MKVRTKSAFQSLPMVIQEWKNCTKCEMGKHVRNHVFIDTIPPEKPTEATRADIVFIGEGPGMVEDVKAIPFAGPAGRLLRQAIAESGAECSHCGETGYDEKEGTACAYCLGNGLIKIALLNLLVCRPYNQKHVNPGNRPPTKEEVANCMPRLVAMLKQLNPVTIFMLGQEPQSYISVLRNELAKAGRCDIEFVCMKHPAYLLRQEAVNNSSLLYTQYVQQMTHYFEHYFNCNRLDSLQEQGTRAGSPRAKRT